MIDFFQLFLQSLSLEMKNGKYLALTIVGIFFLWLLGKYKKNKVTRVLLLFGITMSFFVIVPVSGYLLSKYQTAFFSYRHLLLLLFPMVFIPWALTEAVEQGLGQMKRNAEEGDLVKEKPWLARIVGISVAICLLMLSGNILTEGVDTDFTIAKDKVPTKVMEVLELLEDGDVLVAPDAVIEYARSFDGDLKLIYGRDMFTPALKAFTYHTYDETACQIYEWIQNEPLNYFDLSKEELEQIQKEEDQKAFALISATSCNALVLPHQMYERAWGYVGVEGMGGFEMVEETTEYVVLKRR